MNFYPAYIIFLLLVLPLSSLRHTVQADEQINSSSDQPEETTTSDPSDGGGDSSEDNNDSGSGNDDGGGSNNNANQGGDGGSKASDADDLAKEDLQEEAISSNGEEDSHKRHRHFPKCKCLQKFRTSYLTGNVCGRAALCYWELWNYKYMKAKANGTEALATYKNKAGRCDRYMIEKHTCLIGYPLPRIQNKSCAEGLKDCEGTLSKLLFHDCGPLRKSYGLLKPHEVDWRIRSENLNYDLTQDKSTVFRARPLPEHPKWNNYYIISCPVIYHYPFFTIDLLLKDLDPTIQYDETSALNGVAELIPKFAREGMNNERILNFDALSLDESYINWCGIPRNYVCVRMERDKKGEQCNEKRLEKFRTSCKNNTGVDQGQKKEQSQTEAGTEPPNDSATNTNAAKTEKPKAKKG